MDTRTKEAFRYLGYGRHAVDEQTLALVEASFQELSQVANARIVYRIFDVSRPERTKKQTESDTLSIGGMKIKSKGLSKSLEGCGRAYMLGATLGVGVDRLIRRHSVADMAKAVAAQACAAVILEEYLDSWQAWADLELIEENKHLRPRFSPGYGDFDIRHQEEILRILDAAKKIGLTMTEGYMLTPTKSVTAVAGIAEGSFMKEGRTECGRGCRSCGKEDCTYRRNEG